MGKQAYMQLLSRLSGGSIEPSKKLPLRFMAVFRLSACAEGRPCLVNPTIPIATTENRLRACQTMEFAIEDMIPTSRRIVEEEVFTHTNEDECEEPRGHPWEGLDPVEEEVFTHTNETECEEPRGGPWAGFELPFV